MSHENGNFEMLYPFSNILMAMNLVVRCKHKQ